MKIQFTTTIESKPVNLGSLKPRTWFIYKDQVFVLMGTSNNGKHMVGRIEGEFGVTTEYHREMFPSGRPVHPIKEINFRS